MVRGGEDGAGIPIGKPCVGEVMEFTEACCEALQLLRYLSRRVLFCSADTVCQILRCSEI